MVKKYDKKINWIQYMFKYLNPLLVNTGTNQVVIESMLDFESNNHFKESKLELYELNSINGE